MHRVRVELLHPGQQVAVERELQHVRRLGVAAELGVDDFVAVVAERGGTRHLAQEVRVADEVAVQEGGLVNEVGAGRAGRRGLRRRTWLGCQVLGDFDDGAAGALHFAFQVGQVRSLELVAAFEEQLGVLVGLGLCAFKRLVVERAQVECRQVRALVEVHEVGGGEEEFRAQALHSVVLIFH